MKNLTIKISKILITVIISLILLIAIKSSRSFKKSFYNKVYESNISFAKFNSLYQKYFGNIIPINNLKTVEPVFKETITYNDLTPYLDGVKLTVAENYYVPSISDGVVVFVGEKEQYGNVIIINQSDGIDIWYGNMSNINVKLYDYVSKGSFIGDASNSLYLVYKKNGKVLDYEKYL